MDQLGSLLGLMFWMLNTWMLHRLGQVPELMRHGLSRHILLAILHFFVLPLLARLVGGLLSSLLRKESPLGFWLEFGVLYLGSVLTCAFLLA